MKKKCIGTQVCGPQTCVPMFLFVILYYFFGANGATSYTEFTFTFAWLIKLYDDETTERKIPLVHEGERDGVWEINT